MLQCTTMRFFSDHFLSIGKFKENKELHVAFVRNEITSLSTIFDHRVFPMKQLHWPMSILGSLSANSILHLQSLTNFFGPPAFVSVKYTVFGLQMPPPPNGWHKLAHLRSCTLFSLHFTQATSNGGGEGVAKVPRICDKRCVER